VQRKKAVHVYEHVHVYDHVDVDVNVDVVVDVDVDVDGLSAHDHACGGTPAFFALELFRLEPIGNPSKACTALRLRGDRDEESCSATKESRPRGR
jgi:hypothetical protein